MAKKKVRTAIIGVGNCASALVQGVQYYQNASEDQVIPGIMNPVLGGYHIGDIEFSAAIDINAEKVGKDLSEAIWVEPNNTIQFSEVPHLNVPVSRGMTHDGLGRYLEEKITIGLLFHIQALLIARFLRGDIDGYPPFIWK